MDKNLKWVLILSLTACALLIFGVMLPQIDAAKDANNLISLIPDSKIPWKGSVKQVEEAINQIYSYTGLQYLLKQESDFAYRLFSKDGQKLKKRNMLFIFDDGKLRSYFCEFNGADIEVVKKSAKLNYKDGVHGRASTKTREFYIFEKPFKKRKGTIELYIVYDRLIQKIRTQSRFISN